MTKSATLGEEKVRFSLRDTGSESSTSTLVDSSHTFKSTGVEEVYSVSKNEASSSTQTSFPKAPTQNSLNESIESPKDNGISPDDAFIETLRALFYEFFEPKSAHNHTEEVKAMRKKLFGLTKGFTETTRSDDRFDYERKYLRDRHGKELAENARVWFTYLDEADAYDREKVEGLKETADVLLVFAGLFSGIIATFVSQASQSLQQNYTQLSASLLFHIYQVQMTQLIGTPITVTPISTLNPESPFRPSTNAFLVNSLWFTSLAISLSAALVAVLTKQWLHYYISTKSGTALEKARARHFRFQGLELWKVHLIVDLLPILLNLALGIFLIGVIIFLFPLDTRIAWATIFIAGFTYTLYLISVILPIRYPDCPYTTSLTIYVGNVFYFFSGICCGIVSMVKDKLADRHLSWRISCRRRFLCWSGTFRKRVLRSVWWHRLNHLRHPCDLVRKTFHKLTTRVGRLRDNLRHYMSTQKFVNWREANLNKAIQKDVVSLDREALYWLPTVSFNPSVRRIVARGISVHPALTEEVASIFGDLLWALMADETDPKDLRYGLCLDLHAGHFHHWYRLQEVFDAEGSQLDEAEYRSYSRIAKSVCDKDHVQILKCAFNDDTLRLPLAMWHSLVEKAQKDDTLTAQILACMQIDPFNWAHDPSCQSTYDTGIVPFGTLQQWRWIFGYLFRHFCDRGQPDYTPGNGSFETRYLLLVSIYRNLTSDHPIIVDEKQRRDSLQFLFRSFDRGISTSDCSYISSKHYLTYYQDILSVNRFWKEPMTDQSREFAITCFDNISALMDTDVASFFPLTESPDISRIIRWCSRNQRHDPALIALLFIPQSRSALFTTLSSDLDAPSHFSRCLRNFRCCENIWIGERFIYPNLLDLFNSAEPTSPLFNVSVLLHAWMLLVSRSNPNEFFRIIKAKLDKRCLENLYAVMLEETSQFEQVNALVETIVLQPNNSGRLKAYLTYVDGLRASLNDFKRIAGITRRRAGSMIEWDVDTEACQQKHDDNNLSSVADWIKKKFGSVQLQTSIT